MSETGGDSWSAWLDDQRFSGGEQEERLQNTLHEYRETVLDHADLAEDDTVLDVGAGDGLIAFGALDRLGSDGTVILSDISEPILEQARTTAEDLGSTERCEFVIASAQNLEPISDESVDAVTLRSVLIFVEEKERAFSEFERVLTSGGTLSIFEPIADFTREMKTPADTFMGYDMEHTEYEIPDSVRETASKLQDYGREQSPDHETAMDFDERDLFALAETVGFEDIHLNLHAYNSGRKYFRRFAVAVRGYCGTTLRPSVYSTRFYETEEWESWLTTSFGPESPTKKEAMEAALTPEEREQFTQHVRPLIESRTPKDACGTPAYLWATKPDH